MPVAATASLVSSARPPRNQLPVMSESASASPTYCYLPGHGLALVGGSRFSTLPEIGDSAPIVVPTELLDLSTNPLAGDSSVPQTKEPHVRSISLARRTCSRKWPSRRRMPRDTTKEDEKSVLADMIN